MESYFLDAPIFSEPNGNTVLLTLKNNVAMRSILRMEAIKSISTEDWSKLKPLDQEIIFYTANFGKCTPKMLEAYTKKSRQTLIQHLKALSVDRGGPVEEHSSSPQDPTKYYTIR